MAELQLGLVALLMRLAKAGDLLELKRSESVMGVRVKQLHILTLPGCPGSCSPSGVCSGIQER